MKKEFLEQVVKDGYYLTWDDGHRSTDFKVIEIVDEENLLVLAQPSFANFTVCAELELQYKIWLNPQQEKQIISEHVEQLKGNTRKGFGQ